MYKKFMIRCDMEGVSGVVSYDQTEPGKPEYAFGKKMFMADLMAAINGLNDGGADEIAIYDEHFYGRNIDVEKLPGNVTAYCGKSPYREDWAGGIDETFQGLVLLGFHSMRGTGELLHHTYEPDIKSMRINGITVGEIGLETAVAGDYGVPLVMITGDSAGVEEAKKLMPAIVGVVVKESKSDTEALCYPLSFTTRKIYDAAKKVAETMPAGIVFSFKGNVILEIDLFKGTFKNNFKKLFSEFIDNDTVTINANSITSAYSKYWEMKNIC